MLGSCVLWFVGLLVWFVGLAWFGWIWLLGWLVAWLAGWLVSWLGCWLGWLVFPFTLSVVPPARPSLYLSLCLHACPSVCPSVRPSVRLSVRRFHGLLGSRSNSAFPGVITTVFGRADLATFVSRNGGRRAALSAGLKRMLLHSVWFF